MLPTHSHEKWKALLKEAPRWAIPENPQRFFELLQKDDLFAHDVDDLIAAAGVAPRNECEKQWRMLQGALASEDAALLMQVVASLRACRRLVEGLECLLTLGREQHIANIRLHRFVPEDDKLVSVACAGHESDVAMRLRLGHIVKFRQSSPQSTSDSFWSLHLSTPVVFVVDETSVPPLEPCAARNGIYILHLPYNQCDNVLARHRASMWIDFPLIVAEHVIGKLSCDICASKLTNDVIDSLAMFWQVVQLAVPYLAVLLLKDDQRRAVVVRDAWEEIQHIQSLDKLFEYCTTALPAKLGCRHASLFTVSRDSIGTEKLILRKTSFSPCQVQENIGHYDLGPICERSLTTWVVRSGRALRLQNLNDAEFFEKQRRAYGNEIVWLNKFQDSHEHISFLAVPIVAPRSTLPLQMSTAASSGIAGALRLTEKEGGSGGACFTETDERILLAVARDAIGPKLASLIHKEISEWLLKEVVGEIVRNACQLIKPSAGSDLRRFGDAFCEAMHAIFPEGRFPRLYLLNVLRKGGKQFEHFAIGGGLRAHLRDSECNVYHVERSLTGHTLSQNEDTIFVNDLRRAEEEGVLINIAPTARSALAQRLECGGRSGTIVLESEGYDIAPDREGPFLRLLAGNIGRFLGDYAKVGFDD